MHALRMLTPAGRHRRVRRDCHTLRLSTVLAILPPSWFVCSLTAFHFPRCFSAFPSTPTVRFRKSTHRGRLPTFPPAPALHPLTTTHTVVDNGARPTLLRCADIAASVRTRGYVDNLRGITTARAPNVSLSTPCLRSTSLFRFFPVLDGSTLASLFCFSRLYLVRSKFCKSRLCLDQANASTETKSSLLLAAMLIATPAEKTVPSGRGRSSPSRDRPSGGRPVGQAPPPGQTVTHHATSLQVCRALLRKALRWQTPKRIRADTERRVVSLRALLHMAGTWQPNVA